MNLDCLVFYKLQGPLRKWFNVPKVVWTCFFSLVPNLSWIGDMQDKRRGGGNLLDLSWVLLVGQEKSLDLCDSEG